MFPRIRTLHVDILECAGTRLDRPPMSEKQQSTVLDVQVVACPTCNAQITLRRSDNPYIDFCGFESYSFDCKECGTPVVGIVDPIDDALLISPRG
jgi:hypothetical protein